MGSAEFNICVREMLNLLAEEVGKNYLEDEMEFTTLVNIFVSIVMLIMMKKK